MNNNFDMIGFLKRVYVWIPRNNPMRKEIKQVVEMHGGRVSERMNDQEYQEYVASKQQPLANEPNV